MYSETLLIWINCGPKCCICMLTNHWNQDTSIKCTPEMVPRVSGLDRLHCSYCVNGKVRYLCQAKAKKIFAKAIRHCYSLFRAFWGKHWPGSLFNHFNCFLLLNFLSLYIIMSTMLSFCLHSSHCCRAFLFLRFRKDLYMSHSSGALATWCLDCLAHF